MKTATHDPARWVEGARQILPGFDAFTLDCPYPLPEIPAAVAQGLQDARAERGLTYLVHTPVAQVALGDVNSVTRDMSIREVKRALDLAALIDAPLITVHPTPCPDSARDTLAHREHLQRDALDDICDYAEARGVAVAIENMHPRSVFAPGYSDMSGLFALLAEINRLEITLDVGHANVAGVSLRDAVLRLRGRLRHIHIHDNDGSADQHLPVGRGTVDWLGLTQSLKQIGYTGVLEFEFQGEADLVASKKCLESLFR